MGIENFFNTITKNKISSTSLIIEKKIDCNYLYIDFNSILYITSSEFEHDVNYYLYSLIINEKDDKSLNIEEKYNINFNTIEEFNNYFTQENINEIMKKNIYNYIKNLCKNLINSDTLKEIYISIDGTPTMSKIVEQKKRRYMNYLLSNLKKQIYEVFKNDINTERKLLYDNLKSFNKNNMLMWSIFMQEIYNYLISPEFKAELTDICNNLNNILVSSSYEFGEGEKKIIENILLNKKSGSYIIFSPDSDVILLSLLVQNKLLKNNINNTFNLIRHDQQNNQIENISICNLRQNIYEHIYNKMNTFRKYNHNKNNIIDDVIGLMTLFGNDFLPKIETLNMKIGFNIIFDVYAKHLNWCRSLQYNLLFEENGNIKINYDVLTNIITRLGELEDKIIYDKYMSNEIKNYKYLSSIFESNTFTPFFIDKLNRYCHGYNKIIRYIKNNLFVTASDVYENIIEHFNDKEEWCIQFMKIENNIHDNIDNIKDKIIGVLEKIIEKIQNNQTYKCGLKLIKYNDDVIDRYHQNIIKESLLHPKIDINNYDNEIYKLEKRMDKYKKIGVDEINKIGICELKYKDSEYKIHVDKDVENKKNFFYKNILNCPNKNSIDNVCREYLKGFFWIIDFYFNKNNRNININNISIWYYKYDHTPFLKELSTYIENMHSKNYELNKLYYSLTDINSNNYVRASQFLNKFEQYIYITPKCLHMDVPENYKKVIDDSEIFVDINDLIKRILNGENNLFDTYNAKFINKGHIIGLRECDYYKFMNTLGNLRESIIEN
jgi:5'-3' exonuclease